MKTFTLANLRQALTTAPFQILDSSVLDITSQSFADTQLNDEHLDSKFYPELVSVQQITIDGIPLVVTKKVDVAFFVSLDTELDVLSGYLDEEHFYSLAEHEILFSGDNIAIVSDDGEILTQPTDTPNVYSFTDEAHQQDIELTLPELSIDETITALEPLLVVEKYADALRNNLNELIATA